jgi:hypothetical protein
VVTKSRKSIANFKVRANFPVGCMVTLRGARMYEFFDRLVNIAMPRIRDFRGVSNRAFDGRGNYNLGFKEQIIFPEIDYDKIDTLRGMNIAITTTARTDDEARRCCPRSASRSSTEGTSMAKLAVVLRDQKRRKTVENLRASARRCSISSKTPARPTRPARRLAPSCRSCRATPRRCGCATAAR